MNRVIMLTTDWEADYWHVPKIAQYRGRVSYRTLADWDEFARRCPVAGLGIYYKAASNIPFVYLRITGMEYDSGTENPSFRFDVIKVSSTSSAALRSRLTQHSLMAQMSSQEVADILANIGEIPPAAWLELADTTTPTDVVPTWRDFLGTYFLSLEQLGLGDAVFEDRVACLLGALGFAVVQKGHKRRGAFADGIATYEDIGIVYDCKNSSAMAPTEGDLRALRQYTADEAILQPGGITLCGAFVARDYQSEPEASVFCLKVEPLLYLLSAKLRCGEAFTLRPIKLILQKKRPLDNQVIEELWGH